EVQELDGRLAEPLVGTLEVERVQGMTVGHLDNTLAIEHQQAMLKGFERRIQLLGQGGCSHPAMNSAQENGAGTGRYAAQTGKKRQEEQGQQGVIDIAGEQQA